MDDIERIADWLQDGAGDEARIERDPHGQPAIYVCCADGSEYRLQAVLCKEAA